MKTGKRFSHRNRVVRLHVIVSIVFVVMTSLILETVIISRTNSNYANKTTQVLLNQVIAALERNKSNEQEMIDSLKEDYILRAEMVAYVLDKKSFDEKDSEELQRIAEKMDVDEIHLFDEQGVIYAGTVPKYYGLDFSSGEQIGYFAAMLKDKNLKMCQDVMPNTAEGKNMMYAITWNESGTRMIQVGIEPKRLLEELHRNKIPNVIDNIPSYDGLDIYVAQGADGAIIGATDASSIGKTFEQIGVVDLPSDLSETVSKTINLEGYRNYCKFQQTSDYVVMVAFSTESNLNGFLISMSVFLVYMLLAGAFIFYIFNKLLRTKQLQDEHLSILESVASIYYSMHILDLQKDTAIEFHAQNEVKAIANHSDGAREMMVQVMSAVTVEEYKEAALEFTDLSTIAERMKDKKFIAAEFVGKRIGWFLALAIAIDIDSEGRPTRIAYMTRSIDEEKKKEESLIQLSNTDELTGLFNRRAYEEDITQYEEQALEEDLVFVSMDVNCLKIVNDKLGHKAGDELLIGASQCMKKCFGEVGRLYRVGGDEFVVILHTSALELKKIQTAFEQTVEQWHGKKVQNLTVSCGYVSYGEDHITSIHEMMVLADQRMYEAKTHFYQKNGMDRRGQKDAHIALCDLYAKILKVNLTQDTFMIVNMNEKEGTETMEYSNHLSEWLQNFGKTGQVHPEDMERYLEKTSLSYMRDYFNNNESSLRIFYRRKHKESYQQVMMELIPANDYRPEDQNLYLYVKDISE